MASGKKARGLGRLAILRAATPGTGYFPLFISIYIFLIKVEQITSKIAGCKTAFQVIRGNQEPFTE